MHRKQVFGSWYALVALSFSLCAMPGRAERLLPEGGDFEAGSNGFAVRPVVRLRNWPGYQAPSIDTTTAGQGQRSLKIVNASGQELYDIFSRAFRVADPTGPLSISFYARTDTPGATIAASIRNGGREVIAQRFTLDGQWKRYYFTDDNPTWDVTAKVATRAQTIAGTAATREGVRGTYYLFLNLPAAEPSAGPWKTIWIDGLQVEKGPVTDYVAPALSLAFSANRSIAVYHPDQTPEIVLHAAGKQITRQPITVQIEELLSGVKEPAQKLTLAPDGDADHGKVTIPLAPRPRGCYRITASSADGSVVQYRGFGVIESLASRPHAQRAFFGGSIETIKSARASEPSGLPRIAGDSLVASHYNPDQLFALARDLGWGWWHAYWPHSPYVIQPDGTDFTWTDTDTVTSLARKHDLEIMANLAAHGGFQQVPDWLKGEQISKGGAAGSRNERLVEPEKFKAYANAVAAHYKDQIKMWEPWNEPGVKMRAEEYVPRLQAAYEGIKAADPEAKVYGLCGTWDAGGDMYGWVKACMNLGAADFMDAISIHGYHVKERAYAAKVRQAAKEISGRDFEVVDSEAGPSATFQVYPHLIDAYDDRPSSFEQSVSSMPQLYINEMANGVKRGSWFNLATFFSGIHARELMILEYDGAPTPAFIAYNTVIDLLGPARHVKSVPVGGDVAIEVFDDGKGQALVALWANGDPQTLRIPLKNASDVSLIDLQGRSQSLTGEGGSIQLALGTRPVFLRSAAIAPQALANALGDSSVVGLDRVVITRAGLMHGAEGQPAIAVVLQGKTARPVSGAVEVTRHPDSWPLANPRQSFTALGLDETRTLAFPLSHAPGRSADTLLGMSLDLGDKVLTRDFPLKVWSATAPAQAVTVDGELAEWGAATFRPVADWTSSAIQWNQDGVYFAVRAQDSTPQDHIADTTPWMSDCVELFFNPFPERSFVDGDFVPGDSHLVCPVRGAKDAAAQIFARYRGQPAGSELNKSPRMVPGTIRTASTRTGDGYTMEVFVPWSNFPEDFTARPNAFLGFSLSVRDGDNKGVEIKRVIWSGDNVNYRNTRGYGVLLLQP